MVARGYARVCHTVKRFLEIHGYEVHIGAWVDVKIRGKLVFDFQVGHWAFHRPPKRGVKCALYVFTEGKIPRKAREWLKGYDYLFCPSKFVKQKLEEIDLDAIYMPVGVDTDFFKPMDVTKFIHVLSIGIWESSWDNRKFMDKVIEVAFPYTCYVHTKPTLPQSELPRLYNSAFLYVSLSGCEGFNIPVLEANACAVPVIYNDAPATNEHVFGIGVKPRRVYEVEDRGIYFEIHEPDIPRIREVVHSLLKDTKRIEHLGKEARQHALKYDFRKTYRPLLEVLPKP